MNTAPEPFTRTVLMTVAADGSMTVMVDGMLLPHDAGVWTRESFAAVLDRATDHHRDSAVVEVREADGSSFTDRIAGIGRRSLTSATNAHGITAEVNGSGFLPGEEVAIALVARHLVAESNGTVHACVPTELFGGVLLLGRESGTLHICTDE